MCSCSVSNNFGITIENDIVGGSDKNYTHGTILTNSVGYAKATKKLRQAARFLPAIRIYDNDPDKLTRIKTRFGQEIHTPSDIGVVELIENNNPYAGLLFTQLTRVNADADFRIETSLTIGLVGKYSFSEHAQKFVHNDLGKGKDPKGWDHQLPHELVLNLEYLRSKKFVYGRFIDRVSEIRFRSGNIYTDFNYKNLFRVGRNLPQLDGSHTERVSAYAFGGTNIALVGRNIFYDGTLFRKSHSVDTKHFVSSLHTGVGLEYLGYSVKFNVIGSTRQYSEQEDRFSIYGGLVFGADW